MLYRFHLYLCKINTELKAYLIMGDFRCILALKKNLHYTKLT